MSGPLLGLARDLTRVGYRAGMALDLPVVQFVERPGVLDLSWGHPHPTALPTQPWAAATHAALTEHGWQGLTYGHGAGPGPLREWLADRISRTEQRACDPSTIFVTAGASHALDLLATLSTREGDLVVVDAPTYHLALDILADAGVELVSAPTDEGGIDPVATAQLVTAARRDGRTVRLIYLVPTFCNPTGSSLRGERREALVDLARRLSMTIVEDDTYREFAYDNPAPPSLWSIARADEVVRVGSFAKSVAPGLRLGWINASAELVAVLERRGYVASGGGVNHMVAMTMAEFGISGRYDHHLDTIRRQYARQRDALVAALRTRLPELTTSSPPGGWFVWAGLPAPCSATTLLEAAERQGVSFAVGSTFFVDGRGDDHMRLSFSMLDTDDLTEAIDRLAVAFRRLT